MSFSPDISASKMLITNVFTRDTGATPFRLASVFRATNHIYTLNFRATPMAYPTLYSFDKGGEVVYADDIRAIGADYLIYTVRTVVAELPNLSSAVDRSGFLAWDEGFLSIATTRVWAYENGLSGADDEYLQIFTTGQQSDSWYDSATNITDIGEDLVKFYKDDFAAAPFQVFFFRTEFAVGVTERVALNFTDRRTMLGVEQVLTKTQQLVANGTNWYVRNPNWVISGPMSAEQAEKYKYPWAGVPVPVEGGTAGDVELYNQTFNHKYDSGQDFFRQSLKTTFKTPTQIRGDRDRHISAIVGNIKRRLSITSEVPRGATTRRQASPLALRESYSTFSQVSNSSTPSSAARPSSRTTSGMMTAGTGDSY